MRVSGEKIKYADEYMNILGNLTKYSIKQVAL